MAKIKKLKNKKEKNWKDNFWIGFIIFVVVFSLSITIAANMGNEKIKTTVVTVVSKEIIEPDINNFLPEHREYDLTHLVTVDMFGVKNSLLVEKEQYGSLNAGDTLEVRYKIRFNGSYKVMNYFE